MSASAAVADTVFVQPHFDDVALSCGAAVARLAESESPVIVTVFGGQPATAASEFARFQHERWALAEETVIQTRREEDRAAARALGEAVRVVWLDYLDAIYRDERYGSDEALFGDPVDADIELIERIAGELAAFGERFAVPLGVGNHVDHQLVHMAGRRLAADGHTVWCYADLPYALDRQALRWRLDELGNPAPCARSVSTAHFERRWQAIECYKSQLPVLFRDLPQPREAFEQFGGEFSDRLPVELFWSLSESEGRER